MTFYTKVESKKKFFFCVMIIHLMRLKEISHAFRLSKDNSIQEVYT